MSKLSLSFKNKVLKSVTLPQGELLIGSDPQCPIHIDNLAVGARHASVTTQGDQSVLRDLGSAEGTFVNNQRIEEHTLKHNDQVRIGKFMLSFEQGPAPVAPIQEELEPMPELKLEPKAGAPRSAWLQLLNGSNVGKTISLNRSMTNLGKPGVQTAVIARRNDGYFLSHLEGDNPPLVDGSSIGDKSWELADGQVIQIGNVKMLFSLQ